MFSPLLGLNKEHRSSALLVDQVDLRFLVELNLMFPFESLKSSIWLPATRKMQHDQWMSLIFADCLTVLVTPCDLGTNNLSDCVPSSRRLARLFVCFCPPTTSVHSPRRNARFAAHASSSLPAVASKRMVM